MAMIWFTHRKHKGIKGLNLMDPLEEGIRGDVQGLPWIFKLTQTTPKP